MQQNILWLASWYPNKLMPYEGDFIQRHARAVSLLHKVHVISLKNDDEGVVTKGITIEDTQIENLTETVIYYKPFYTGIKFFDSFIDEIRYKRIYKKTVRKYLVVNAKPLVHVHVAMKAGVVAVWLKKKYGIRFILSEHWTGFLKDAKPNINQYNFLYKKWCKQIFSSASIITAVSKTLAQELETRYNVKVQVIANVVDINMFHPVDVHNAICSFIHISTNKYQKNTEQILMAFAAVKKNGYAFQLIFYVPDKNKFQLQVDKYLLTVEATVNEEVPQYILARELAKTDALILYSHYETFGCVVIEANACGVPALLSDLPVFREYCLENKTAFFAKPNDVESLKNTIISFIKKEKHTADKNEIAELTGNKFRFDIVANQFDEVYKKLS